MLVHIEIYFKGRVPLATRKGESMIIDVRTGDCLYVTINGWVYYIDDSTNEQIIEKWSEEEQHARDS